MTQIQVLEGSDEQAAIERLKTIVTLSPKEEGSPTVALRKQSEFVVAPVMHKGTLNADIVDNFFTAIETTGQETLTAIGLYSDEELHCYSVPATPEGLNKLRGTSCGVVNFVLFAGEPDWAIVFDSQLYVGYGPEPFVTALVGDIDSKYKEIETRLNEMYEQTQDDIPGYIAAEINRMGEYLDSALTKLGTEYSNAPAGEMVSII